MSNKLVLYSIDLSPPVRMVKLVLRLLGLEPEFRNVDLTKGEHLQESYIKLNPEHTVPTLVDGDFVIWDSHAICAYLVDKYGKDDQLYPKDLQLRAKCNQRLFFDAASLFPRLRDSWQHVFMKGFELGPDEIQPMHTAFDILEAFLDTEPFLVGQNYTIADISVAGSIIGLDLYAPLPGEKYPKIMAWLERVKAIPFFDEVNTKSTELFHQMILNNLKKKQNQ